MARQDTKVLIAIHGRRQHKTVSAHSKYAKGQLKLITILTNHLILLSAYGSTSARSYPVSMVLSGRYLWQDGKLYYQNSYGDLPSSMPYSSAPVNLLASRVGLGGLLAQNDVSKAYGFPLRCVEISAYGSTSARSYPVSLVYSGYYFWRWANLNRQNSAGDWWTSTAHSSVNSYGVYIDSTLLLIPDNYEKEYGVSLHIPPMLSISIICARIGGNE